MFVATCSGGSWKMPSRATLPVAAASSLRTKVGAPPSVSSVAQGHAALAKASQWLTGDALDGKRTTVAHAKNGFDTVGCGPWLSRRCAERPSGCSLSARGSQTLASGASSARGHFADADVGALTARGGNYGRVTDVDFGKTDEDRRWILKQIETKAGQKFKSIHEAFRFVDSDRDGYVDQEEMRYFFRAYDFPAHVADRFFAVLDVEHRKEIDYDYFMSYFRPHVLRGIHGQNAGRCAPWKSEWAMSKTKDKVSTCQIYSEDSSTRDSSTLAIDDSSDAPDQLDRDVRAELRLLMQDIGRKLPLKFKAPRDAFRVLDLERNGRITKSEMRGFFRGFGYLEDVADRVFNLLEEEMDGKCDFAAFMSHFDQIVGPQFRAAKRAPLIPVEDHRHQNEVDKVARAIQERMTTKYRNVQKAFRDLDLNKDGSVDRHEMRVFLKKLGHERSADVVFDALDEDNSGEITYDEFVALCGEMPQS